MLYVSPKYTYVYKWVSSMSHGGTLSALHTVCGSHPGAFMLQQSLKSRAWVGLGVSLTPQGAVVLIRSADSPG